MSSKRKLVFVPEELVNKLREASNKEGKSFILFLEESLTNVLKASEMGYSQDQINQFIEAYHAQRISMTLVPLGVLDHLIKTADKDELRAKWYGSGEWYGKYLKEKFDEPVKALGRLLKATRWDLDEIEVREREESHIASFRCVSAILSAEGTTSLLKFIEGAMHGLGYETGENDSVKGIIHLKFIKDDGK